MIHSPSDLNAAPGGPATPTPRQVLALPMGTNDSGADTVRGYLAALLAAVWKRGERPFGRSDWDYDLYLALLKAGFIVGKVDVDGYIDEVDSDAGDRLIAEAIEAMTAEPAPGLPRDWCASEVAPGTPYRDEPSVMVPPGVYLLGGFTDDPEDGPQLMLRVEHALDNTSDDEKWTPLSLAQAVADRLNGGA